MTRSVTCRTGQGRGWGGDSASVNPLTDTGSSFTVRVTPFSIAGLHQHGGYLLRDHAKEAEPELAAQLNPDWEAYEHAESTGQLIVLGAWAVGSTIRVLVGYVVASVAASPHYCGVLLCQHDVLYVDPPWRRRGVGLQLIRALRVEARARGAAHLIMHAKIGSPLETLLQLGDARAVETVFMEQL